MSVHLGLIIGGTVAALAAAALLIWRTWPLATLLVPVWLVPSWPARPERHTGSQDNAETTAYFRQLDTPSVNDQLASMAELLARDHAALDDIVRRFRTELDRWEARSLRRYGLTSGDVTLYRWRDMPTGEYPAVRH